MRSSRAVTPRISEGDDVWIGTRLRELRKDRGLSIQQIADRVGLSDPVSDTDEIDVRQALSGG